MSCIGINHRVVFFLATFSMYCDVLAVLARDLDLRCDVLSQNQASCRQTSPIIESLRSDH
jgi:hypothetical protein